MKISEEVYKEIVSSGKLADCGPFRLSTMRLLFDRIDDNTHSSSGFLHGRSSPRLQRAVSPRNAQRQSEAPVLYDAVLKILVSTVPKDQKTAKLQGLKNLISTEDIRTLKECAKISLDDLEPRILEINLEFEKVRKKVQYLQ